MVYKKKRRARKRKKKLRLKQIFLMAFLLTTLIIIPPSLSFLKIPSLPNTSFQEKVEILYFRNDGCPIVTTTDPLINQAIDEFGDKISVRRIEAQLNPSDPEDTDEIKMLREKYDVIGLPEIVINGKKFTKSFNKTNLFTEICNNFIVKPQVCG